MGCQVNESSHMLSLSFLLDQVKYIWLNKTWYSIDQSYISEMKGNDMETELSWGGQGYLQGSESL